MKSILKIKYLHLWAIILITLISAIAQANPLTGTIKGKITTSDHQAVPGASILIKGTTKGTATNLDGFYILSNVNPGKYTVVVSYVGLNKQEKEISVEPDESCILNFELTETSLQLSEVTVEAFKSKNEVPVSIGKISIAPMDLPQSVTYIDKSTLELRQVQTLGDALMNVNGVYVMGTTGGTQEELAGRGFSYGSSNTFKNGVRFNNSVKPQMNSLERVEVMKGSNAILFGNVAPGGVINLVTKKPTFQNGGVVTLQMGSYNLYSPSVDVYGSFNGSDIAAYRLNTSFEKSKSFRDVVSSERIYINPSFLVKIGDNTRVLVEGDFVKDDRTSDYGISAINYEIAELPRSRFLGAAWSYNKAEQQSLTSTVSHILSEEWQLKWVSGIGTYKNDLFGTARPNASSNFVKTNGDWIRTATRTENNEKYYMTQFDVTGDVDVLGFENKILVGFDADKYESEVLSYVSAKYDTINVFDMDLYKQRNDIPELKQNTLTENPQTRYGIYVQNLISVTDQLKFMAGIRYTKQTRSSQVYTYLTNVLALATEYSEYAFTPRIGLVFKPVETMSLFASYANSFNPNNGKDANNRQLAPSYIDQYEIGTKNDLFDGLISANLTFYQIVNSNLAQTVNPAPASNPTAQELAGEVTSKGFEIDITTKQIEGFSFIGGYSFNDTRYTKSNTFVNGSKLRYNPQHTANASVFYSFDQFNLFEGLNAGITAFYIGERVAGRSTTAANPTYKLMPIPNYFLFDFTLGYTINNVTFKGKISNLFDQLSYNVHDDNSVNPIAPRLYSATFSFKL